MSSDDLRHKKLTDKVWDAFAKNLRANGERVTTARQIVFYRVFARHDHFTADELARELVGGHDRVSRGTVYRTLALMVKAGIVRDIRDCDTHRHYEHIYGHADHYHMICDCCGRFIEFESSAVARELDNICSESNFSQSGYSLVIFGRCRDCTA